MGVAIVQDEIGTYLIESHAAPRRGAKGDTMRCPAAFTCCADGCFSVVLSVPMLAAAVEPSSPSLKATEGSLSADGFEVSDLVVLVSQ